MSLATKIKKYIQFIKQTIHSFYFIYLWSEDLSLLAVNIKNPHPWGHRPTATSYQLRCSGFNIGSFFMVGSYQPPDIWCGIHVFLLLGLLSNQTRSIYYLLIAGGRRGGRRVGRRKEFKSFWRALTRNGNAINLLQDLNLAHRVHFPSRWPFR